MSLWQPAPEPPTKLGVYRTLSERAGVRVSPICLGAMSIGDQWNEASLLNLLSIMMASITLIFDFVWQFMGSMDKESSFKLLDAYFDMGGNFIDTANNYQHESSERFIGEWMEKRQNRDQLIIATKGGTDLYTTVYKIADKSIQQKVNYTGNNSKSLHLSLEDSLKKLRTSYIDILYVHWWDFDTSVEEVMDSLHNMVVQGKVLYLGISDTPAWIVSQANQYAKDHGKTPFVIYQGKWSLLDRSFERDIIPMARSQKLTLAPWGVLEHGRLRTDTEEQRRKETGEKGRMLGVTTWERNEKEVKMSHALEKVAKEVGAKDISAVAIAYVMQKTPYVFPIIGGRKIDNLVANLEALDISLSDEHIEELESVLLFDVGFPTDFIGDGSEPNFLLNATAKIQRMPYSKALRPQ
ncbi:Aldo/keto reductase [Lentinula raphanica]|uniref:Aldo/keto reductase n=1 Tax=Lentinula raphanica TaxID=153919 RepID=A0AA38P716_9AGAR|nr:Aldo/keto reductase [Lentinula raphanica]